jgi:ATP-dependent DNA helicase MPH1
MAEGREEDNWNKSKEAYDNVQRHIVQAEQLELYADVPRLLPDAIHPQVLEMTMEIEEYSRKNSRNPSTVEDGGKAPKKAKRKRDDNVDRNAPGGVAAGFQSVGEMFKNVAAKKVKGKQLAELDPLAGTDDDTDRDIEAGPLAPSRRASTNRKQPEAGSSSVKKPRKRKSDAGGSEKQTKGKKATPKSTGPKRGVKCKGVTIDPVSPTLSERGRSDTDDEMIEKGFDLAFHKSPSHKRRRIRRATSSASKSSTEDDDIWTTAKARASTQTLPSLPVEDSFNWDAEPIIELDDSAPSRGPSPFNALPITHPSQCLESPIDMIPTRPSSPLARIPSPTPHSVPATLVATAKKRAPLPKPPSPPVRRSPPNPQGAPEDISWLLGSDEEDHAKGDILEIGSSPPPKRSTPPKRSSLAKAKSPVSSTIDVSLQYPTTPVPNDADASIAMPPPDIPFRVPVISPSMHPTPPEPTYPIGRGGAYKRIALPNSSPWSVKVPSPSQRHRLQRLQRERTEEEIVDDSPLAPRAAKRVKRRKPNAAILRAFVDDEAGHSGGEVSEGTSGEDQPESEGDRRFLFAPPESQVPAGYAQTQVYRQSLQTQVPNGDGPIFAARPAVRGRFGPMRTPARRPAARGSSPPTDLGSEPDAYSYGSFVVDDEEDIVYEEESSQLHI